MGVVLVVQVRGVLVAGAYGLDLGLEQHRVFLGGVQPIATAVGLEFGFTEQAVDLRSGDRLEDAAFDRFRGQFGTGPMGDGQAGLLRGFAGQSEQQGDLLGRELAGATGARVVGEEVFDGVPQFGGSLFRAFGEDEAVEGALPAPPPDADLVASQVDSRGDVLVG